MVTAVRTGVCKIFNDDGIHPDILYMLHFGFPEHCGAYPKMLMDENP